VAAADGPSPAVVTVPRAAVPVGGCLAVGPAGEALLVDVDGEVVAYRNRCLHVGRRLDGGVVRDGVLTCPHHLWRYRIDDGRCVAGGAAATGRSLAPLPTDTRGTEVAVTLPTTASVGMRDRLLDHARTWDREAP
jgi:nitrite reductase/ring-hydroxylating ferredoxin subunit